jgi:hypothetical protein
MQTRIQFGSLSTFQEWSNFKGILSQGKIKEEPLIKKGGGPENLVLHLTKQLEAGGVIKEEDAMIPFFSESLKQAS